MVRPLGREHRAQYRAALGADHPGGNPLGVQGLVGFEGLAGAVRDTKCKQEHGTGSTVSVLLFCVLHSKRLLPQPAQEAPGQLQAFGIQPPQQLTDINVKNFYYSVIYFCLLRFTLSLKVIFGENVCIKGASRESVHFWRLEE